MPSSASPEEEAPPPPPLSPPPALEPTTIGNPSPPSTWASGGVFSFPDDEEEEDEEEKEEREINGENAKEVRGEGVPLEGDGADSIDSVESKLRRRLGIWSSVEGEEESDGSAGAKPAEVLQSWGSVEWRSIELEDDDDEEEVGDEDETPEKVIERVRKRLGWGVMAASRLKPIDFRLSMDKSNRTEEPRRQVGRKPPLSPGTHRNGDRLDTFNFRSTSSWESLKQEWEFDDSSEEMKLSSGDSAAKAREPGIMEVKEEDQQSSVVRNERELSVNCDSISPAEKGDASAADRDMKVSGLPAGSHTSPTVKTVTTDGAGPAKRVSGGITTNHRPMTPRSEESRFASNFDSKTAHEQHMKELQSEKKTEDSSTGQVPNAPLLLSISPSRPEPALVAALPSSNDSLGGSSDDLCAASPGHDQSIPTETAKTLDSLVSLVVQSWEHDFFSGPSSEQQNEATVTYKQEDTAASKTMASGKPISDVVTLAQSNEDHLAHSKVKSEATNSSVSVQYSSTVSSAEAAPTPASADINSAQPEEITLLQRGDDDNEDSEVPGEKEDQIVQMLLERIVLLEEALRQVDR
ncbi:unnamed protein product [Phytophthora fragariaefolia]|uniref:Unnamed protein product n=1 Tax=Phytophthora fragariaefolia TaxID=1490495 RepID=A0A9W6Y2B3_9STRA|nr:unnamed protein product [Phytophthora fragariaefolia]